VDRVVIGGWDRGCGGVRLIEVNWSRYTPWRRLGWEEVWLLLILKLGTRWGWVVSVTPRPRFTPGKRTPGTHCTGGWVGPRAGLDAGARRKILCPYRGSNLVRTARCQTLYWLSYRGGVQSTNRASEPEQRGGDTSMTEDAWQNDGQLFPSSFCLLQYDVGWPKFTERIHGSLSHAHYSLSLLCHIFTGQLFYHLFFYRSMFSWSQEPFIQIPCDKRFREQSTVHKRDLNLYARLPTLVGVLCGPTQFSNSTRCAAPNVPLLISC
jgi:hypothetical protein